MKKDINREIALRQQQIDNPFNNNVVSSIDMNRQIALRQQAIDNPFGNRQIVRREQFNEEIIDDGNYDIIDRNLEQFNVPQMPNVIGDFGMFDINDKLQNILGDRDNRMRELIGFDRNMPINIQEKIIGKQQDIVSNNIITQNIGHEISPAEKIRRMLEW